MGSAPSMRSSVRAERTQAALAGLTRVATTVTSMATGGAGAPMRALAGVTSGVGVGASESGSIDQIRQMNAESQGFQMEYLQIQQQVQDDNRRFSLLTNVMRSHHETTKAAIQNIRS